MVVLWDAEGAWESPGSYLGLSWKPFGGLGGTSKASEGSLGQLLGALEGYWGTWIALEALLGDTVGAHGGPECAKPWGEYPKPSWAPAMGGSLGQSREDVGHILGSFGEPSGVKKGRGKRLRSFSTEC